MALTRWIAMRQARDALYAGQLEAAHRHLEPYLSSGRRGPLDLARQLSKAYRFRAEKALRNEHPEAAWKDLRAAEDLPNSDPELAALRTTLTKLGLAECRAALAAGRPAFVVERLAVLRRRRAFHPEFDPLELAARNALLAQEQADRGEFEAAIANAPTERAKAEFGRRARELQAALPAFAESMATLRWADALQHASTILNVAPNHREARAGKTKAWDALQPIQPVLEDDRPTQPGVPGVRASARSSSDAELQPKQIPIAQPVNVSPGIPRRFLLWIDGVGGYLVCTGQRVAFGQAANRGPVDVPLLADVSRLHAEIHRDGEGYVLESGHDIAVNGTPAKRTVLKPEDRITFGSTCQLVFQQPVPVSPTAKLELVSGHRLPVAVDAVWLMADNLVLGPSAPAHIVVPDLPGPAVFYRSKEGLGFRFAGKFRVDGEPHEGRAMLRVPCHVNAEHLSFALEALAAKG